MRADTEWVFGRSAWLLVPAERLCASRRGHEFEQIASSIRVTDFAAR